MLDFFFFLQEGGVLIPALTYKALIEPFIQPTELTVDDNAVRRTELLNLEMWSAETMSRENIVLNICMCLLGSNCLPASTAPHIN